MDQHFYLRKLLHDKCFIHINKDSSTDSNKCKDSFKNSENHNFNPLIKQQHRKITRGLILICYCSNQHSNSSPNINSNITGNKMKYQSVLHAAFKIIDAQPRISQILSEQITKFIQKIRKKLYKDKQQIQQIKNKVNLNLVQHKNSQINRRYLQQYIDWVQHDKKTVHNLYKNRLYSYINSLQVQQKQNSCLGCITQVIEDRPLPNTGQVCSILANLGYQTEELIKKKAVAILNSKGGYLFYTHQQVQKAEIVGSSQLNMRESFQKILTQFKDILTYCIYPNNFQFIFEYLPVMSIKGNTKQNTGKSVLRITLIPNKNTYLYFAYKIIQKNQSYQALFFQDNLIGEVQDFRKPMNAQKIYEIAHYQFITKKRKQKKQMSFLNYKCIPPLYKQENIDIKIIINNQNTEYATMQNVLKQSNDKIEQKIEIPLQKIQQLSSQLQFKHSNNSLVILSTQNDWNFIEAFRRNLQQRKISAYNLYKPYPHLRNNSMRSILLITHNQPSPNIQQVLKLTVVKNCKFLALITVTFYIIIKNQDPKEQRITKYFQSFYDIFRKQAYFFTANCQPYYNKILYDIYIKVDSYQQAIFTFVMLQNMRIKLTFSKQKQFKPQYQKYISAING